MIVVPVDDRDVGLRAGQGLRGEQSAETRADDDDARPTHAFNEPPDIRCIRSRTRIAAFEAR